MKKLLFLAIIASLAILNGCKKEYAIPKVSAPANQTVEVATEVDLTFSYTAEAGYKASTLVASNGTATIKTNGAVGSESGTIVVAFTAGSSSGAGSVILTLVDGEAQAGSATAVITVFEEGAPSVTAPESTSVEVIKSVDITFTYAAEGGYKSSSVTATNGTAVVKTGGTAGSASGSIVVTYTALRAIGAGSVSLTVTDNNNKEGMSTAVMDVQNVPTVSVTDNITENTTWETGKVYILEGRITVLPSKTLTIQSGVIVKGRAGTGSNATALLVARGGKLMAEGTAEAPIIFTSVADMILPGEIASPNLETHQ